MALELVPTDDSQLKYLKCQFLRAGGPCVATIKFKTPEPVQIICLYQRQDTGRYEGEDAEEKHLFYSRYRACTIDDDGFTIFKVPICWNRDVNYGMLIYIRPATINTPPLFEWITVQK